MEKGKLLGLLALTGLLSACVSVPDSSLWRPPLRRRIEFVMMPGEMPFPEQDVLQALHTMQAELAAFSGYDVALVDALAPYDAQEARRCFINFTRPGTGRASSYVADEFAAVTFVDERSCTIRLRAADMISLNYLSNALTHEAGHTVLPRGYHNPDPRSIMYPTIREGRYRFTERDLQYLEAELP